MISKYVYILSPILWLPDANSQLIGKDPDAGRDWEQEEKGTTEDEMARWHHRLNGRWVWVNSGSWCWTGRPGVLRFMGSQSQTRLSDWSDLIWNRLYDIWISIAVVVQSPSRVQLFTTPWTAACQTSLSFTISQSLLKLMSIESVMPSSHLILHHPLLLLPSIFPSIRVFSNELAICIRQPKYWS